MRLHDIVTMLDGDEELEKLAMEGGQDSSEVINAGAQESAMTQQGSEPAGAAGNVPSATPTTGAGVDGQAAGMATATEVAASLGDSPEDQKIKLKEQLMEQSASQHEANALAEKDELPGQNTAPVKGEMINLSGGMNDVSTIGYGEKAAAARVEQLVALGLEKEAEVNDRQVAEDNYDLGQIFGHGFCDFVNGKDPAFQKEASILDSMADYTEEQIDEALSKLSEEDTVKLAEAVEEKKTMDELATDWYGLGREYARGMQDELSK